MFSLTTAWVAMEQKLTCCIKFPLFKWGISSTQWRLECTQQATPNDSITLKISSSLKWTEICCVLWKCLTFPQHWGSCILVLPQMDGMWFSTCHESGFTCLSKPESRGETAELLNEDTNLAYWHHKASRASHLIEKIQTHGIVYILRNYIFNLSFDIS